MISEPARTRSVRPGVGRPSREQQAQRHEELLDQALDTFLERGFESTTMEEIAICVGMSKRTLYAYHVDKPALFRAAVKRAVERYTIPRERIEALGRPDLAETLTAIARLRLANVATPIVTKLQRILAAQSYRFPELADLAFEEGAGPTVAVLVELFEERQRSGELRGFDPREAATAFLSLVVGGLARRIVLGGTVSEKEIAARTHFAVGLFLDGARRQGVRAG